MTRILIVDDDPGQLEHSAGIAASLGYRVERATGGAEALRRLRADRRYQVVLLDLVMPDIDGMGVLETLARERIDVPVIAGLPNSAIERVRDVLRHGACDCFVYPLGADRLLAAMAAIGQRRAVTQALADERAARTGAWSIPDLIGPGASGERARAMAERAAKSPLPFLIEGEAGTGKQMLARAVHALGERSSRPFVSLDCGALDPQTAAAVLFGARKGAQPGLRADLAGKLGEAQGGTLYLDAIGELPPALQATLAGVLADGQVTPLGATQPERVNVRIIVGTGYRLLNLAKAGRLREDLYYRLSVLSAYLPPLRDCRDELPAMVRRLLPRFVAETGRRVTAISPEALDLIASHDWPGNRRQLEAAIYRAVVLCETETLMPADFPMLVADVLGRGDAAELARASRPASAPVHIDATIPPPRKLAEAPVADDRFVDEKGRLKRWDVIERDVIAFALDHHQHRMSAVARALGMGRSTLYRKLREYGLGEVSEVEAG